MKTCSLAGSKMLLANKIAEFLKQLCLKKDEVNQHDIFYVDRDSGKVNCDLKNFGKVGPRML